MEGFDFDLRVFIYITINICLQFSFVYLVHHKLYNLWPD